MPEFGTPFSGLAKDRKLTNEELVRAIRFMVAAEYEAIQLYMQLAESTENKLAIEVLKDIADEERVHAGEFLRLLRELAPDEDKFYAEGSHEVEEEIGVSRSAFEDFFGFGVGIVDGFVAGNDGIKLLGFVTVCRLGVNLEQRHVHIHAEFVADGGSRRDRLEQLPCRGIISLGQIQRCLHIVHGIKVIWHKQDDLIPPVRGLDVAFDPCNPFRSPFGRKLPRRANQIFNENTAPRVLFAKPSGKLNGLVQLVFEFNERIGKKNFGRPLGIPPVVHSLCHIFDPFFAVPFEADDPRKNLRHS